MPGFEFRIVPENPDVVEWQAPFGGKIGGDVWPLRRAVMEGHEARKLRFDFGLLVCIIEAHRDRAVGAVDVDDEMLRG